jgi:hypothetical protein
MVCRVVLNSRAMALILIPALIRTITVNCCSSFSTEGRPNRFPAAFARAIPECVRSSSKSLSNWGPLGKRKISHAKDVFHTTSVVMPDFDGIPTTAKQTSQNIQIFS